MEDLNCRSGNESTQQLGVEPLSLAAAAVASEMDRRIALSSFEAFEVREFRGVGMALLCRECCSTESASSS